MHLLSLKSLYKKKKNIETLHIHIVENIANKHRFVDYSCGLFEELPSRNSVKKAIKSGILLLNGKEVESGRFLQKKDEIRVMAAKKTSSKVYPLPLEIVYEDEYLAIIHKPSGIPVSGNYFRSIENALEYNLEHSIQKDVLPGPRPVHRLDAPTMGLLLIAKTKNAQVRLGHLFQHKKIKKIYHALVSGKPEAAGNITLPINGQEAISHFHLLDTVPSLKNNSISLLELSPETGRTHQLRIHLAKKGFPIIGDTLYGEKGNVLKHKGLFLAAIALHFTHPITGKNMSIKIDTPHKFKTLLEREQKRWEKYNV